MRCTVIILASLILMISANALALVKPVASADYDGTYSGVGAGWHYTVLYRDNYCYQAPVNPCLAQGEGEGRGSHPGVDIPCPVGTSVRSIAGGVVTKAQHGSTGWGNHVVIRHDIPSIGIIYSVYGHLSTLNVSTNDQVGEDQQIGLSGNSGDSTGPHLHFQIDRHTKLDGSGLVPFHPYWPSADGLGADDLDPYHLVELNTINPMPLLQMNGYAPCYVPVGFSLNPDYSGYPEWRNEGVSAAFRQRYDAHVFNSNNGDPNGTPQPTPQRPAIGFPWTHPESPNWISHPQAVHKVDDMWIQDFYGPHNGLAHPYTALIKGENASDPVCLLKEGFWDYWMTNVGWVSFGPPITDEYFIGNVPHQTFRKGAQTFVFAWENGAVDVEYLSGISVNMNHVTFTTTTKTEGDGVYHSNLSVTDFNVPILLIQGETYNGFYAELGGTQIPISSFTVNGDMVIVVDEPLPPIANFSASPMSGYVPLTVQFTDLSSLSVTSWFWEFGDGGTSTLRNPEYIYNAPGNYTVSLTVSNSAGSNTVVGGDPIVVNHPPNPVANFSATPMSGDAPLTVQFTDLSTGVITAWFWWFDDGSPVCTEQNPTHVYTRGGSYIVNLMVYNSGGSSIHFAIDPIVVIGIPLPIANFVGVPTSGQIPLTVQFTDTSTGGPASSWWWSFGDGTNSAEQNPSHVYTAVGSYDVMLEVYNSEGTDLIQFYNYITVTNAPSVSADFIGTPTSVYTGSPVQFTDQSTGSPTSWLWNFGDESSSSQQNPAHVYSSHGTYTVSLIANNSASSDTLVRTDYITSSRPPSEPIYPHNEPNPSNPFSVISFKINKSGNVQLSVYDLKGRVVATLIDGFLEAGIHEATFNGSQLSSGTYFYMIRSADGNDIGKIMVVK